MLTPVYGFVEGDTIGMLLLPHDDETIDELLGRLKRSAAVRVVTGGAWRLEHNGKTLDPKMTLAAAGVRALDRVDARKTTP